MCQDLEPQYIIIFRKKKVNNYTETEDSRRNILLGFTFTKVKQFDFNKSIPRHQSSYSLNDDWGVQSPPHHWSFALYTILSFGEPGFF